MLIAAAAAMFAACQQEDVIIDQSSNLEKAIGFTTYTPSVTRAENSSATKTFGLENYYNQFRVWGYKNIKNPSTASTAYTSTQVFAGTDAKDVVTFDGTLTTGTFKDYQWKYSPVRYWDKTATNYDFYAYTPATLASGYGAWAYKDQNADYVNDTATPKTKTPSYFTLENAKVTGESLPINNKVTGQTDVNTDKKADDAFKIDQDYMIADDIHGWKGYNNPVNFHFNHILSRLNIGVKTTVEYDNTNGSGLVVLESVKVFNLTSNGNFDESLKSGTDLSKGTAARWGAATTTATKFTDGIGYPNTQVPAKQNSVAGNTVNGLFISNDFAAEVFDGVNPAMDADEYKYVFQGLIIPQTVEWEHLAEDGSDLDKDNDVYVEIKYNIDGEEFRAIYNLADVFTANIRYTDAQGRKACKTTDGGVYVYVDESGKYYDASGNLLNTIVYTDRSVFKASDGTYLYVNDGKLYKNSDFTDEVVPEAYILFGADGKVVPVMRSEISGSQSIAFNEGWQNTLNITISPVAILFDADVYEWVTNEEADVTVQ